MSTRDLSRSFPTPVTASARAAFFVAASAVALSASSVAADLMLTQAGIDRGFQLTTFASNFPTTSGIGPRGIDFLPNGQAMVSSLNGQIRRFPTRDAGGHWIDNQSALAVNPFVTIDGTDNANGMGHLGSDTHIYLAQHTNNQVVQLNADGSLNHVVAPIPSALGIAVHPTTGHLFVTGSGAGASGGVFNVDPVAGTFTMVSAEKADGITITPDGSTIYVANYGGTFPSEIVGYNTSTNAEVFRSAPIPGNIDGVALGFGPLTGYIYAVTNGNGTNTGTIVEVNLSTQAQVVIATGGSRGDLCASDPTGSGDVLFTQSNSVVRLSGIPAPSGVVLLGLGGLLAARRRRRDRSTVGRESPTGWRST